MLFLVFSVSSHYVMIFTRCVLLAYMVFADTLQNARYVHSVHLYKRLTSPPFLKLSFSHSMQLLPRMNVMLDFL